MQASVGSRVFRRHKADQRTACATVSEIFIDESENFFLALPAKFLHATEGPLFLDRALSSPLLLGGAEVNSAKVASKSGFLPVQLSRDQEIDTSTFEFSDQTPSTLSTVTSRAFAGFVASTPTLISEISVSTSCILVEFIISGDRYPIVGDLCVTNDLSWGAIVAISDEASLVAVVPFSEIYKEFEHQGLHPAPGSEIERRRRQRQESGSTQQSSEVMAVFELVNLLFRRTGAVEDKAFLPYSFDELGYKLQEVGNHFGLETVVSGLPTAFGYRADEEVQLFELIAPQELLSTVYFDWQQSRLVYDPDAIESDQWISIAKFMEEACSKFSEVA